jgi:hypothetical protein
MIKGKKVGRLKRKEKKQLTLEHRKFYNLIRAEGQRILIENITGRKIMKSGKNSKKIIVSVCMVVGLLIIGCRSINVPLINYRPVLSGDLNLYKGKSVYLMNFDNQANNTSIWYYYSPDKKFSYATKDTLHNYFWYSFRNALTTIGMGVSNVDNPDYTAPAMWVTLLSITDEQYQVRVTVQKKGVTVLAEQYTITEPPLEEKDRELSFLEQRAYRMTNRLIGTILGDQAFQEVLTKH